MCGRIKSDQHIEWIAQGLDAMSMVKKSITVTDQQEAWIQGQLASGNYATDSELIREAIREKQMRADEIARIRAALTEAEDGGMSDKSPEDIRRAVLADLKEDGGL
ncbi:MAG: type II toxin-antitoxin system ParD family antitoxin [Rhodospirillales bacterium]